MFPKSSIRPIWNSLSRSLGGVAVLVVLLVVALLLVVSGDEGRGAWAGVFANLPPKENVLPAARSALEKGGAGISCRFRECGECESNWVCRSVERRPEELNRVEGPSKVFPPVLKPHY
jgi:hypothetical protein